MEILGPVRVERLIPGGQGVGTLENGKKVLHYVAVNARTGETMGSVPIYKGKLLAISALVELAGIIVGTFLGLYVKLFSLSSLVVVSFVLSLSN